MKWWRFTFLVIFVAVLQTSAVMNLFSLTGMRIKPDILLILLVYFAIYSDSYDAIIISFAIGFAADLAGMVLGPHFISYGIIGAAITHIKKVILLKDTRQQAIAIFVTAVLTETMALILTQTKAPELSKTGATEIIGVAVYSAIFWFLIKWPLLKVGAWLGAGVHRFTAPIERR